LSTTVITPVSRPVDHQIHILRRAENFNRDVRPVLAENCFSCHGPDSASRKAGLRLDQRETAVKAPASWFEVSIQVREKLTSSNREAGLFLRANLWF